ncbi:hypothetical protein A3K02_02295 [candidate division WS6 bacterium RIFOXYD1_FULL_33_8]|uniref:LytR/CpsA/Psr regulator C-terminal domain-containing protein n=2 Tax=Candidatus Dojkabacteria TaxID=74243 RepID=A0A0G0CWV5_9BACT|nr:MAG: hypothetical protein UR32_C0003G0058 [candidate division WS6 bacterium GW2011_GWE2_33_157]KKP44667.1 MAG: hypothetical protein UR34_C0001G0013 [candidate division WS6 bacterium GW2011_GWC1_33_20]KKP45992.1 MAG: hypothetical protein UR36_C0002G0034 [candidate division WS6 bacterium GW2011_GWF1_33_233]KKP55495.1 MAG: hypothetical protein UR47_C0001G0056 [candidate division WS6 bacterium GW2011_GWB1_33_6]KKP55576.1 MAG: hypothetical protein UR45_C0001G0058 [candidate division WS6 bacterium
MSTGRERYRASVEKKKPKIKIKFGNVLFYLFCTLLLAGGIYSYISFNNVKNENPLEGGNTEYYLLSSKKDALEKTLVVFEEEYNESERISRVYLYLENKDKQISILVYLPGWVEYAGLEEDFGNTVPVSSFKYAGEFKQRGRGVEYAIWQIEQVLGTNIDEYIWFNASSFKVFSEKLGESTGDPIYAQYYANGFEASDDAFFLNSFISRLGWVNLIFSASKFKDSESTVYSSLPTLASTVVKLKQIEQGTLSSRPYIIDLSDNKYLSQEELVDSGGISNTIKTSEFDATWREHIDSMIDRELEKERTRVEVYNGSGVTGAAGQYARRIRNSGCEVVRFENAPNNVDNTIFYVPNKEEYNDSLSTIMEIFPGQYEIIEGRPSFMTTGDIVIILGKDISRMYSF